MDLSQDAIKLLNQKMGLLPPLDRPRGRPISPLCGSNVAGENGTAVPEINPKSQQLCSQCGDRKSVV